MPASSQWHRPARVMRVIRRFLRLTRAERRLLLETLAMLPLVALGLKSIGLRRSFRIMTRHAAAGRQRSVDDAVAHHLAMRAGAFARAAAARGPLRASCLAQSLTIWWLLRRRGIDSDVCIGVRRSGARLEAHAWTEHRGRVLDGGAGAGARFSPFAGPSGILARLGTDVP